MLAKILTSFYGSFWDLRESCIKSSNPILKKVAIAVYRSYLYENSADISLDTIFEGEPCLPHDIRGVFISGGAKIGKNAVIFQQVTIGSISLPDANKIGAPTIGDNCYIGAGAKIVGDIKIGDNVRIGANTVVYEDVPDNSVVVSSKTKIITKEEPLINRYYTIKGDNRVYFDDGNWVKESDENILEKLS